MKKNMGAVDRIIRAVLAVAIAGFYFAGSITGTAAIVLGIFAVILLLTSATGICPLYGPLGISTLKKT
jgi:hypothetical protein